MKHSAKIIATSMLFTTALFMHTAAQEKNAIAVSQPSATHKTFHVKTNNQPKTGVETNPVITAKFSSLFPNASSQQWIAGADHYWVSFLNDDRHAKASFNLKGQLNYLITDCTIEDLPKAFMQTIIKDYSSYKLFNAIEITAHGTVANQAILENRTGYVILKYTSDGVEQIKQVEKL